MTSTTSLTSEKSSESSAKTTSSLTEQTVRCSFCFPFFSLLCSGDAVVYSFLLAVYSFNVLLRLQQSTVLVLLTRIADLK